MNELTVHTYGLWGPYVCGPHSQKVVRHLMWTSQSGDNSLLFVVRCHLNRFKAKVRVLMPRRSGDSAPNSKPTMPVDVELQLKLYSAPPLPYTTVVTACSKGPFFLTGMSLLGLVHCSESDKNVDLCLNGRCGRKLGRNTACCSILSAHDSCASSSLWSWQENSLTNSRKKKKSAVSVSPDPGKPGATVSLWREFSSFKATRGKASVSGRGEIKFPDLTAPGMN